MNDKDLPHIAILGAGPIGIEAALYARFLGYPVTVYEQGDICAHVLKWGHVQLFTPFGMNSSPLGLSALSAQADDFRPPAADQLHTGTEWVEQYLLPLSRSDLLHSCFRTHSRIVAVSRNANTGNGQGFRLLIEETDGRQHHEFADVVLDTTGTWGQPNPLGSGGMPAIGEAMLSSETLPEGMLFLRRIATPEQLAATSGRHFAVAGSGYSAATNIIQLAKLHEQDPDLRCTWITRQPPSERGPVKTIPDDPLEYRVHLTSRANELATTADWVDWKAGTEIESIGFDGQRFEVRLGEDETIFCDHVLANTGYQGDWQMLDALKVHRCYDSGGPMAWAASTSDSTGDCLQQQSSGPDALLTTEPDFFVLGSKTYGRDPRFLFATGLQQIRDVFKIVADRDSLDVYATMQFPAADGASH